MSDTTYPKTSKTSRASRVPRAQAQPVDEYEEEYDDEALDYDDAAWDDDEEGTVVLASPRRAIALGIAGLALVAVFSVLIYMLSVGPSKPTVITGAAGGVPVMALVQSSEAAAPSKGALAPNFYWQEGNNQTVQLASFRGDKPVFVNFWGTWCPPCRSEMPAMETFYQKHKDEIQMIGVSMYPRDDPTTVLNFVKDAKYSWKFIHDADYKVAEKYQVASVPSSYFIDRNGVIKAVQIGAMTEPMIESYFQQVR